MAHSRYLRDVARSLRLERQLTVDQLAERLALPRSTIYYWVRDLPVRVPRRRAGVPPPVQSDSARVLQSPSREERRDAYERALSSYEDLAVQPTFADFLCVCIASRDCCKHGHGGVALANSDPAAMQLANRWMWRLTDRTPHLSVHTDPCASASELRHFWSKAVGARAEVIAVQRDSRRPGGGRDARRAPRGVLKITVDDALLGARLEGWMHRKRQDWL
jgi:transposase-like protein